MVIGETIEYANGIHSVVVWMGDETFIIQTGSQYAACEGSDEEWYFLFEGDAWRDSFTDAVCDVEASMT